MAKCSDLSLFLLENSAKFARTGYSGLKLNTTGSIKHCETVGVTVDVTNTGKMDSDEVVQLYLLRSINTASMDP